MKILYISVKSISSRVLFSDTITLLIFSLEDLSIFYSGVLKSPTIIVLLSISLKIFNLFIFRESGKEGEREGEKHQFVFSSEMPQTGNGLTTQVCALTRNGTGNPLVSRLALNPLSYTSHG